MKEKKVCKVCTECENQAQKPVELSDEELEKASGGFGDTDGFLCIHCGRLSYDSKVCEWCGKPMA